MTRGRKLSRRRVRGVVLRMRDAPDDGNDQRRRQGHAMELDAMNGGRPFDVLDVDEVLEQLHQRDADDRERHFDLENSGIDVIQPLRPITRIADFQPPDEDLVVALDDHDEQVRHHGDVDQADHRHHDLFAVHGAGAEDEVIVVAQEFVDVDDQRCKQSHVDGIENPASRKDCSVENLDGAASRTQGFVRCLCCCSGCFMMMVCHVSSFEKF